MVIDTQTKHQKETAFRKKLKSKDLVSIGLAPTEKPTDQQADSTPPDHQMPPKKSLTTASQYSKLDEFLLDAIRHGRNPLYDRSVSAEAGRIAKETGREEFRVTDARLQALRKAGQIQHLTKAEIGKEKSNKTHKSGWRLVEAPKPAQDPAEEDPADDEDSDDATESSRPTA